MPPECPRRAQGSWRNRCGAQVLSWLLHSGALADRGLSCAVLVINPSLDAAGADVAAPRPLGVRRRVEGLAVTEATQKVIMEFCVIDARSSSKSSPPYTGTGSLSA